MLGSFSLQQPGSALRARIMLAGLCAGSLLLQAVPAFSQVLALKPQAALTPRPFAPAGLTFKTTLADLQQKAGLLLEFVDTKETLFFPLPRDTKVDKGMVRLYFTASPLLNANSNMRVTINGIPRAAVPLADKTKLSLLEIPLTPADLQKHFVEVSVKAVLVHSSDRCMDERVSAGYLHIQPQSGLVLAMKSSLAPSVRSFWDRLPDQVTISTSAAPLSAAGFLGAWRIGDLLARQGKHVRYSRLPDIGQIVVAPANELGAAGTGNLKLQSSNGHQYLAVTDTQAGPALQLLAPQWLSLARASNYEVLPASGSALDETKRYAITFADLGVKDTAKEMSTNAEWKFLVSPQQIPNHYRPSELHLDVVSAPGLLDRPIDRPVMVAAYLNGNLLQVMRLVDDGKPHDFNIPLPANLLQQHNDFKLTAHRAELEGDCRRTVASYPIQVLPSSTIVTERDNSLPRQFAGLPTYLGDGFTTYLPNSYLQAPQGPLSFLSRLSSDMGLQLRRVQAETYQAGQPVHPSSPFLLLGQPDPASVKAPVRFDQGRVQIRNANDDILLDVNKLPGIVTAQLAASGALAGLWVAPQAGEQLPAARSLGMTEGNVAFADDSGVVLHFDADKTELATVVYPEYKSWTTRLGAYRFWLFAAFWVALTLLVVSLFRRLRAPRPTA